MDLTHEPAHSVGGDIFDYIDFKDGRWAIVVGDVAGKGVPDRAFDGQGLLADSRAGDSQPYRLRGIDGTESRGFKFGVGAQFYHRCITDPGSDQPYDRMGECGSRSPLVRCNDGIVEELSIAEPDFPLGVKVDQTYHNRTRRLKDGELVVLVTDGVSETMNSRRQLFGTDRIKTFLAKTHDHPHTVMEGLIEEVEKFRDQHPQHDDMCVIAFQRRS